MNEKRAEYQRKPDVFFRNGNVYTPVDQGRPLGGADQGRLAHFHNGAILVGDGMIYAVGDEEQIRASHDLEGVTVEDLGGRCVVPGFVDPHTHNCFAARREAEFELRLAGTPYLEILRQGGGILSSVEAVAAMDAETLKERTLVQLNKALTFGTTTIEVKSGYGLDTENELKMLAAISGAAAQSPVDVVPTFLGAHAIPTAYKERSGAFVDLLIEEMLPAVLDQGIARHCDVFCEQGVFSIDEGRRLLSAAQQQGMQIKIHADEVHDLGGAGLAAELGALSADHLLAASDQNIACYWACGLKYGDDSGRSIGRSHLEWGLCH